MAEGAQLVGYSGRSRLYADSGGASGSRSGDSAAGLASFFALERSQDAKVPLFAEALFVVGQAVQPVENSFGDIHLELRPQQSQFGSTNWLDLATPGTEVVERKTADDITGTVFDTNGNKIESVRIFTEADLQLVESDQEGFFRFPKEKGTQTIMRAFKPGYHIWIGMPTAGDRLKIVLEKKETTPSVAKDEHAQ